MLFYGSNTSVSRSNSGRGEGVVLLAGERDTSRVERLSACSKGKLAIGSSPFIQRNTAGLKRIDLLRGSELSLNTAATARSTISKMSSSSRSCSFSAIVVAMIVLMLLI